jgi:hypothetical protein
MPGRRERRTCPSSNESLTKSQILCRRIAFPTWPDFATDAHTFDQACVAGLLNGRDADEDVLAAVVGHDEAVAFAGLNHLTLPVATSARRINPRSDVYQGLMRHRERVLQRCAHCARAISRDVSARRRPPRRMRSARQWPVSIASLLRSVLSRRSCAPRRLQSPISARSNPRDDGACSAKTKVPAAAPGERGRRANVAVLIAA